ncbi:MAG: hypothetical protein D4S02_12165 [Rhodocyclaceae bacterium]|nr:MAG: hypothetical protein D4S02_12165 [Rhodocyclaceae bacterium]
MKKAILALLLTVGGNALAYDVATPSVVSNIQWVVSGTTGTESANNTCTVLNLDASGDWIKGQKFTIYGGLFCNNNATTYGVTGSGFVLSQGGIAMFLSIGSQFYWTCATNPQLGATCKAVNAATLTQVGSPVISLVP